MADVILSSVRKEFGEFVAVHDLDLHIESGEFVALLGPSGCGKTTTLRMLAGLDFPTAGDIRIGDRIVNDVAPGKRDIAMVFQSYALYPHMTVEQNIAYPLKKRGVPAAERGPMVTRAAELLQLEELLARKPGQLSGGQQQRVALGRALVRDPKVFLLDEPLSNLDAKLRSYMRAELIQLHRKLGRTMVYVTHDQLEAMTMSDRIAVMNGGRLQQFATPDEIYYCPANRFVAEFIGTPSMNLIEGEMSGGNVFTAGELEVPLDVLELTDTADAVVLGVRPENVIIGDGRHNGTVRVVEPTGHENIVIMDCPGGATIVARTEAALRPSPGESVRFSLESTGLHVFDNAESGRRLSRAEMPEFAANPRPELKQA